MPTKMHLSDRFSIQNLNSRNDFIVRQNSCAARIVWTVLIDSEKRDCCLALSRNLLFGTFDERSIAITIVVLNVLARPPHITATCTSRRSIYESPYQKRSTARSRRIRTKNPANRLLGLVKIDDTRTCFLVSKYRFKVDWDAIFRVLHF